MIDLSIVVPTLAKNNHLVSLFRSLRYQNCDSYIELVVCSTGVPSDEILKNLPKLSKNFCVQIVDSPLRSIASARNRGIIAAKGKYILFLDDDCSLPHSNYLSYAMALTKNNENAAWGGSYIINDPILNTSSSFYNYMCHIWLLSFENSGRLSMIIGGCSLFPREFLITNSIFFDETKQAAAEEVLFSQKIAESQLPIHFDAHLNVHHNSSCSHGLLFKKAWLHGREREKNFSTLSQKKWNSYIKFFYKNPLVSLKFLPILAVFLTISRSARLWRRVEIVLDTIRRPFPKHN